MAGTWTSERFPQFEAAIRQLTNEHRELEDEPLHLAISYSPLRDQQDIFLFEVIGSSNESISSDRELFETTFQSTSGFPLAPNQRLHLVLTNPSEWETALRESWPLAMEVMNSIRSGDFQVLHEDNIGTGILSRIRAAINCQEPVHG
jgi:hypothetical protein